MSAKWSILSPKEQIQAILRQPDRTTFTRLRDDTMMLVLQDTGMRVNELTQMIISHIDFEEKILCIIKPRVSRRRADDHPNHLRSKLIYK